MSDIEPLNNQIAFRFVEDTTTGRFNQKTGSGLLVVDHKEKQVEYPRWGEILALGPDVDEEYGVGDIVLIENLRWTNMFTFDDKQYWITSDQDILAILPDKKDAPGEIKHFL